MDPVASALPHADERGRSRMARLFHGLSRRARRKRAELFRQAFRLDENTRILDLGSETGSNIHEVLQSTRARPENVHIADINPQLVEAGRARYGFVPVVVGESGALPFPDGYFDVVYCSSVIEHVTLPKERVWKAYSGRRFREESRKRQKAFAEEIRRVGRQYFVQTPYRHFPLESHSWLPLLGWLPRWLLIPALHLSNAFWIKQTSPDWYLMNRMEMAELFPDAKILAEKCFGLTKSVMAVKTRA